MIEKAQSILFEERIRSPNYGRSFMRIDVVCLDCWFDDSMVIVLDGCNDCNGMVLDLFLHL